MQNRILILHLQTHQQALGKTHTFSLGFPHLSNENNKFGSASHKALRWIKSERHVKVQSVTIIYYCWFAHGHPEMEGRAEAEIK